MGRSKMRRRKRRTKFNKIWSGGHKNCLRNQTKLVKVSQPVDPNENRLQVNICNILLGGSSLRFTGLLLWEFLLSVSTLLTPHPTRGLAHTRTTRAHRIGLRELAPTHQTVAAPLLLQPTCDAKQSTRKYQWYNYIKGCHCITPLKKVTATKKKQPL